jgi:hypothetical protein
MAPEDPLNDCEGESRVFLSIHRPQQISSSKVSISLIPQRAQKSSARLKPETSGTRQVAVTQAR